MTTRFIDIINAVGSRKLHRLQPPLSKVELLEGDNAALQVPSILDNIDHVLETLAERGVFITEEEWYAQKYGSPVQHSLAEICADLNVRVSAANGYVTTPGIESMIPKEPAPHVIRRQAASVEDYDAFSNACAENDLRCAKQLWFTKVMSTDYMSSIFGRTPLALAAAAEANVGLLVKFLLNAGANPDARDDNGFSPLLLATCQANSDAALLIAEALVSRYRDEPGALLVALTDTGDGGSTPLENARANCTRKATKYLEEHIELAKQRIAEQSDMEVQQVQEKERVTVTFSDKITRADLVAPQKDAPNLLCQAVMYGVLREALDALHNAGERLILADLLESGQSAGGSILAHIATSGQLPVLFDPKYWVGHVRDMQHVWMQVPLKDQAQMDGLEGRPSFRRAYQQANALSLRSLGRRADGADGMNR